MCGDAQLFALAFISQFMKNSGGFKLDPKNAKNELYQAVVDGYIYALLKNNQLIELYLEEQRSRSGKVQAPNEVLFDRIINMYFNGNSDMQHKDIQFVPVTINYDRIVEGDQFPLDLLGETTKKETFFKVVKVLLTSKKQLGKVIVRYGEPQSLQGFMTLYLTKNQNLTLTSIQTNK